MQAFFLRGHLQTDFSTLNVIMTLRGGVLARDVNNKIFSMKKIKFWLATALTKKMMTLLAHCALMGRSINYLHM